MTGPQLELPDAEIFDVLICGGGLAGLTLALQIRQELPQLRVAVIERSERPLPASSHKVGEACVELSSLYLERLGLRDYLLDHQIVKFGLRFFPGGGERPLDQRVEVGPSAEPVVTSYQLDRGILENDLRAMIVAQGATLIEGATVRTLDLATDGAPHVVTALRGEQRATLRGRWLVDATGRAALLRKQLGTRLPTRHKAHAAWLRVTGKVDINQMVSDPRSAFRRMPTAEHRWRSTNHFMGPGYWVWTIPLSGGRTSIGLVIHEDHHDFGEVRTLERVWAFLDAHEPHLAAFLRAHLDAGHEVLDFHCLKEFSHDIARCWSPDRWAAVGVAASFSDPLYSPGSDFIALGNTFTVELLRADQAGQPLGPRCDELDAEYRGFFGCAMALFTGTGPIYGYAPAMTAKVYWDNFTYWCYHCQYFQQRIYTLSGEALAPFSALGRRYFALMDRAQSLLRQWALLATDLPKGRFIGVPVFPSIQVDIHVALLDEMSVDDTRRAMEWRLVQVEELLAELALRIVLALGPERGRTLVEETGLRSWDLALSEPRLAAELLPPGQRRAALSALALELDTVLYPWPRQPAAESLALLRGTA